MKKGEQMKMHFNDDIRDLLDRFGSVTTYTFMVYGSLSIKDNAIINKGLTLTLVDQGWDDIRFMQNVFEINQDEAEKYDYNRGWNLQWVFPGNFEHEFIPMLISDGLSHLRLEHEYVGMFGSV